MVEAEKVREVVLVVDWRDDEQVEEKGVEGRL